MKPTPEEAIVQLVGDNLELPQEEVAKLTLDILEVSSAISQACSGQLDGESPWRPVALLVALKYQELQVQLAFHERKIEDVEKVSKIIAHGMLEIAKGFKKPEVDA